MSDIEILKKFVEERLDWNNFCREKDQKPSDIGRIEEDKCILRKIEKIIKKKNLLIKENMDEFKHKLVDILKKSMKKDELSVERLYELVNKIAPDVIEVTKEEIMKNLSLVRL